ncbi:subtype B tannase [Devosia sp. 919]|uniref:subtype B tannase n=1 Tax=Devosia sp. 919 TaxID=2726065 RepID=UPI001557B781|nr:subtype B tannase [Devosia sp. 919]
MTDYSADLRLDGERYELLHVLVDGESVEVRKYEATYVALPIAMSKEQPSRGVPPSGEPDAGVGFALKDPNAYHKLHIYIPVCSSPVTKPRPIILQVWNNGWFASGPHDMVFDGSNYSSTGDGDFVGKILSEGFILVSAGARSRGALSADDRFVGKAPAAVVDTKAAIRFLRLNRDVIAGNTDRIVITGTSGGGALSAIVAASGNAPDYFPYLRKLGAAGFAPDGTSILTDDVFATIAYCPITDLGNADAAYEWQFGSYRTPQNTVGGTLTTSATEASAALAQSYPDYVASLGLKLEGRTLTAQTLDALLLAEVAREAERMHATGKPIPPLGGMFTLGNDRELANDWLSFEEGGKAEIDRNAFLRFVTSCEKLKIVPAFDATGNTGDAGLRGENSLFGTDSQRYSNFTPYGWDNNEVAGDHSGIDDTGMTFAEVLAAPASLLATQLRLINPIALLKSGEADIAPYWYVRHGMIDRDTAFAVILVLYVALKNAKSVHDVNFRLAWLKPHAGNYDVQEAFAWLLEKLERTKSA